MKICRFDMCLIASMICFLALSMVGALCPAPLIEFTGTGRLVQGTECVLYRDDIEGEYILDNYGDFEIGAWVRVHGWFDSACVSICQEGDGCLKDNTIDAATGPT